MTNFDGANALITGAAGGIGRLMARKMAARGAHVILWDVNQAGLDALASELAGESRRASAYACDLRNRGAIYETAKRVLAEHGHVDVLVNNAGIVSGKPILEASDEEIVRTFDVNTLALFWTARAFLPSMVARKRGHIVTIASAGGLVGTSRLIDYCASKFAAVGFDESLRLELKRQGLDQVSTTVVCPFYIDTGMFKGVKTRFAWLLPILDPDYVATQVVEAIAKGRRRLLLPRFVFAVYPTRLLPTPIFDRVMSFLGINKTMDEFTGRAGH